MKVKTSAILNSPAVFEKAIEGGFNVSFPAFPGCVTFGKNFEEAGEKAREILELWIEELSAQGEEIPTIQYSIINEISVKIPKSAKFQYEPAQR